MPSYQSVGEISQVETQFQRCIMGSAVNTALLLWDHHILRQNFPHASLMTGPATKVSSQLSFGFLTHTLIRYQGRQRGGVSHRNEGQLPIQAPFAFDFSRW
jgi:hypothetical protein